MINRSITRIGCIINIWEITIVNAKARALYYHAAFDILFSTINICSTNINLSQSILSILFRGDNILLCLAYQFGMLPFYTIRMMRSTYLLLIVKDADNMEIQQGAIVANTSVTRSIVRDLQYIILIYYSQPFVIQ